MNEKKDDPNCLIANEAWEMLGPSDPLRPSVSLTVGALKKLLRQRKYLNGLLVVFPDGSPVWENGLLWALSAGRTVAAKRGQP